MALRGDKAVEEKDARDMRKFVVDFNRAGASFCEILDKMKDDDNRWFFSFFSQNVPLFGLCNLSFIST